MRLYISNIMPHDDKPSTFEFNRLIENSGCWDTKESAERDVNRINETGGITVKSPDGLGRSAQCTDFQIVSRPLGGFAISCEHPFSTDTIDSV
jgi:hypothetical protein